VTSQINGTNVWDRDYGPLKTMTAAQLRRWSSEGIEIGAHSRSHPDLTTIGAGRLVEEIAGSAEDLQRLLGLRPISFAYPYGAFDEKVKKCAGDVFELAFTTTGGLNDLTTDPHLLRRSEVASTDLWTEYKWRVRLGYLPAQRLSANLPTTAAAATRRLVSQVRRAASG
jgi:peptidoglycan/xylan/chitin deacetylase (PgdA/CDA1 family)